MMVIMETMEIGDCVRGIVHETQMKQSTVRELEEMLDFWRPSALKVEERRKERKEEKKEAAVESLYGDCKAYGEQEEAYEGSVYQKKEGEEKYSP